MHRLCHFREEDMLELVVILHQSQCHSAQASEMAWQLYIMNQWPCVGNPDGMHDLRGTVNLDTQAYWPYLRHTVTSENGCAKD